MEDIIREAGEAFLSGIRRERLLWVVFEERFVIKRYFEARMSWACDERVEIHSYK